MDIGYEKITYKSDLQIDYYEEYLEENVEGISRKEEAVC